MKSGNANFEKAQNVKKKLDQRKALHTFHSFPDGESNSGQKFKLKHSALCHLSKMRTIETSNQSRGGIEKKI